MVRKIRLKYASPILVALLSGFAMNSTAQTCPCNYMVCAICVQTTLPAIKVATKTAFKSLSTLHLTMDQTIEAGVQAEIQSVDFYTENIVGALQADALSITTTMTLNDTASARLFESFKESLETNQKTVAVAKSNLETAENFGIENVSHVTKSLSDAQYSKVIYKSPIDTFPDDGSTFADISFFVRTLSNRKEKFLESIIASTEDNKALLNVNSVIQGSETIDYKSDIVSEGDWDEAIAYRTFLAIPLGVQSGLRNLDMKINDDKDYAPIRARSKVAGDFLAWELALKSEVITDAGPTSFYNFIKTQVVGTYESTDGMLEAGTSGTREGENTVATNEAISNILDMLILEVSAYNLQMENAKLGALNDSKYNANYGYQKLDMAKGQVKR